MSNKKYFICIGILYFSLLTTSFSQVAESIFGQTIQITTRFHSFVGKPTWLLIIRDLDHGENIPYMFDIRRGKNFWLAFTRGRNYLITASILSFSPYLEKPYRTKKINNFCQLESHGHIMRGKSLVITLEGNLSLNPNRYSCHVMAFHDTNFVIVTDPTVG